MIIRKVLSLTEPYASLICYGKKRIEIRSWKTNYRGELYIHASKTIMLKESLENAELMKLVDNHELHFTYILCKCQLVDGIFMMDEFIENIRKNHPIEYLCEDYKPGRYNWILEDVIPFPNFLGI